MTPEDDGDCSVCGEFYICCECGNIYIKDGKAYSKALETTERYYVTRSGVEREVSEAEYISAEREAGFHPMIPNTPATSAFSNYTRHISGRMGFLRNSDD